MFLYHGTNAAYLPSILSEGLKPRKMTKKANWQHAIVSNRNAVYLTDAYAIFWAKATPWDEPEGTKFAVIQVDSDSLLPQFLGGDEDTLEQGLRGRDELPSHWTMDQRTRWYRKRLLDYNWHECLKVMGNCSYHDVIHPEQMAKIAIIDFEEQSNLIHSADPTMVPMNYMIMGAEYRSQMRWLFDLAPLPGDEKTLGVLSIPKTRRGITVYDTAQDALRALRE